MKFSRGNWKSTVSDSSKMVKQMRAERKDIARKKRNNKERRIAKYMETGQISKAIQEVSSKGLDKISEQGRNRLFPKSDEDPITADTFKASNVFQMKPKEIVAIIKSSDRTANADHWNMSNQIFIDIVNQDVESPEETPPSIKGLSKGTIALTTFFNLLGINKFPKTMHHVLRNLRTFYIVKKNRYRREHHSRQTNWCTLYHISHLQ
jgi:hypothetical protein